MGRSVERILGRSAFALLLIPVMAACSDDRREPAPAPATPSSSADVPSPVAGRFTGFTTPCPTVQGRIGTRTASNELYISTIVKCSYGAKGQLPVLESTATINKPLAAQGTPDEAAGRQYEKAKASVQGKVADGITVDDRAGLGDEAYLVISSERDVTFLVVRSANVMIQTIAQVESDGDSEKEIKALKAQEPLITELAKALLAQLK
jgi:hypothetical protein